MTSEIHHYDSNGRPCDKYGRIIKNPDVLRDGQSITVPLTFADARPPMPPRADDDGQALYEARVYDSWKPTAADFAEGVR